MIILEFIVQFIFEVIYIELLGGMFSSLNNKVLKLRGIETKSVKEITFDKLNKSYLYKRMIAVSNNLGVSKGTVGIVIELIDNKKAFVEFKDFEEVIEIPLNKILLKKMTGPKSLLINIWYQVISAIFLIDFFFSKGVR